jgi:hypothetical protein
MSKQLVQLVTLLLIIYWSHTIICNTLSKHVADTTVLVAHQEHTDDVSLHIHCSTVLTLLLLLLLSLLLPLLLLLSQVRLLYGQGTRASQLMLHALCRSLVWTSTQQMAPLQSVILVWLCLILDRWEPLVVYRAVGGSALSALCKVSVSIVITCMPQCV